MAGDDLIGAEDRCFRELAENIREVFWVVSPDWNVVHYVSPTYAEVWGRPCSELYRCGRAWLDAVLPEDRPTLLAAIERAREDGAGGLYATEYRVGRPDGTLRWVEARGFPVRDGAGRTVRVVGIAEDVTERHRREEDLRRGKREYQTLAENLPGLVYRAFPAEGGRMQFFNGMFEPLTGFEPAELPEAFPCSLLPLIVEEDRPRVRQAVAEAMAAGRPFAVAYRLRRRDGAIRHLLERGRPVDHGDGSPAHIDGVIFDVTEQAATQAALLHREAQLRGFFDTNAALMSVVELEDDDLVYVLPNEAMASYFGLTAAQLTGMSCRELGVTEEILTGWLSLFRRCRESGEPLTWEYELALGERRGWYHGTISPLPRAPDLPPRFALTTVEITARKQAEDEMHRLNQELELRVEQRTEELHQRAEQLARLASELTLAEHRERRQLARALHDNLQQLLVGAKIGLESLVHRVPEAEEMAAERVGELLDESIAVARSLTVELSPPIIYEADLADGLNWLSRWMREKYGLAVDLEIPEDEGGDGEDVKILVFESVRELLFNVVKHARADRAWVAISRGEGRLRVTVRDEGEGFDPGEARRREGALDGGFGLVSVRERLGLMGGGLKIDAAPGRGTEIELILPVAGPTDRGGRDRAGGGGDGNGDRAAAAAPASSAAGGATGPGAPGADGHGSSGPAGTGAEDDRERRDDGGAGGERAPIRVAIVDDHAMLRQGLMAMLALDPAIECVGEADDGVEAIEMARRLQPDVILMDFSLPGLDGVAATRSIKAAWPRIRVIGLSMYDADDRAAAMLEAGASRYVTKSCGAEAILNAIHGLEAEARGA